MNVFKILKQKSKFFFALILFLILTNAVTYSAILYLINKALAGKPISFMPEYNWLFYFIVIAVSTISNIITQRHLIIASNELLVEYELSIARKVRDSDYEHFQNYGKQRVQSAIDDSWMLAEFPRTFVNSLNSLIIVACSIFYIFYINIYVASVFILILFGLILYFGNKSRSVEDAFNHIKTFQNTFFKYLADLLDGYKEVKMYKKRGRLLIEKFALTNRNLKMSYSIRTYTNEAVFALLAKNTWYLIIGLIIFASPRLLHYTTGEMTICVLIILNMVEPINFFVGNFPFFSRVEASLKKLDDIFGAFNTDHVEMDILNDSRVNVRFEKLCFENLEYHYREENGFMLGPLNLAFRRGEVVFIQGGNGSGKTTFVNILTGLLSPDNGCVRFNNIIVGKESIQSYRDKFAVIFTNNHIFSENYDGFDLSEKNPNVADVLGLLKLTDIIRLDPEKNYFGNHLSKGQLKRLALAYALLEDKEILVLDEWAAEQDPEYRKYFYHTIVPAIKNMGKLLILVTHDDRYFSVADRMIKFEYGKIVSDDTDAKIDSSFKIKTNTADC